jgi:hypothetical protein
MSVHVCLVVLSAVIAALGQSRREEVVSGGKLRHKAFACTPPLHTPDDNRPTFSLALPASVSKALHFHIFFYQYRHLRIYVRLPDGQRSMCTAPPDPGEEQRGVEQWEGVHGTWECNPSREQTPIVIGMCMGRIGREGVTGPTASKIRESVDSMKTYGGLGGVSIAPAGFTKVTSTANTTSAAVDDCEHIRRPCFHIRLARFFVDPSLSRHKSSIVPSRRLHNRFSNHHSVVDFDIFDNRHLGHEHVNYTDPHLANDAAGRGHARSYTLPSRCGLYEAFASEPKLEVLYRIDLLV